MTQLDGRAAIVTGGGTGIGRATARLYGSEGARVVVADTREDEGETTVGLIRSAGGEAVFVKADVTSEVDIENVVARAEQDFGAVHIMTANAGILGAASHKRLSEIALDEFIAVLRVNLVGVFLAFKHALPAIERAGGGAMTATASICAHRGVAQMDAYSASKGGIVGLVRSLAADAAPRVRVNAVSPGAISTEIKSHYRSETGRATPPGAEQAGSPTPLGDAHDIAKAHLFLVSEQSGFITGQSLIVDGGWTSAA